MDPYLEDPAYWSDFHGSFLLYLRDFINERLPDHYEARIDEKVNLIETSTDRIKLIEPDLAVSQARPSAPGEIATAGVATLEPVTIPHLLIEEETHERWIEILHRPERSLVAVLELLSPANKEEPGLYRYRDKRFALLMQDVHLIEIDLLVAGRRLTLRDPLPRADYYALVSRGDRRPECQVYAWTLRNPLPPIPLPLKARTPTCPSTWARSSPPPTTRAAMPAPSPTALRPRFTCRRRHARGPCSKSAPDRLEEIKPRAILPGFLLVPIAPFGSISVIQ